MPTHPPRAHQPTSRRHTRPVLALLVLGACLMLAACGSSSGSGGSTNSANSKSARTPSNAPGAGSAKSMALRECLSKQGVTLPSAPAGGNPQSSGSAPPAGAAGQRPGGGFKLPKGESAAQLQAALKKCGGGNFPAGGAARFRGAGSSKTFAKFTACMRENGVDLPAANTSGKGPVFDTKGINTSSAAFKSAESKCSSDLGAAAAGGGPPNGTPSSGGPPSGGGSPPSGEAPAGGAPPTGEEG
jgi:hypothetical protein